MRKNTVTTLCFLLVTSVLSGQSWTQSAPNIYFNGGNVGIGVTTPQTKLEVWTGRNNYSSIGNWLEVGEFTGLHFGYMEANALYRKSALVFERLDNAARGSIHVLNNGDNNSNSATLADAKLTIDYSGNVGVGLTSPHGKLHIRGVGYFGNENGDSWHRVAIGGSGSNYGSVGYGYKYSVTSFGHTYAVNDYASQIRFDVGGFNFLTAPAGTSGTEVPFTTAMKILQNGNVGIGSTNPTSKLTVKGTVHAEEVKVDLSVPGPDYVFEESYQLQPLHETKAFIRQNKHLPEVPSARELEENGIHLGEMNMLLLKKVEELTLHLIRQQEEIEALKKEVHKR